MSLRTIPYGYKILNCEKLVNESEAAVVFEIFNMYVIGKTLKEIADYLNQRGEVYYTESPLWNKNIVNRIIENTKYIGDFGYPQIIDKHLFEKANSLKNGGKKIKLPDDIEYLKTITYCSECGYRFRRINKWRSREKWICSSGCKCSKYIDDKSLTNSILDTINAVVANPELLNKKNKDEIETTPELMKHSNQLNWLLEQPKIDYKNLMKSVVENASLRFDSIKYNRSGNVTEELKNRMTNIEPLEKISVDIIKKYIRAVWIGLTGNISVEFYNYATVSNDNERMCGCGSSCNENRNTD